MKNLIPTLIQSVEKASKKLLDHFQSQYGSVIFIPLGVGAKTPEKIAPSIAESIQTTLLSEENETIVLNITDEKVGQVFDAFINSFFNSLNFIAKGIMKALGMKMVWNDFSREIAENKTTNPTTYERWKKNLTMVLAGVFSEIVADLKTADENVSLTNGTTNFESVEEAIAHLKIFE